ncbi:MAG: YicC/YloC family endoribonuclease [Ignavibacteria bacterium]|nr:YicC/YloC family endoribonuclease [Ignavibacteria bacterium]MDP3582265.1 YicC/YloC family endoribonuclease [Ignavibacteria bacterium]
MISSMTGYGKGLAKNGDLSVEAEIKSLNSRYLELSLRLPKFLQNKEFEVRERVKSKIKRGKVYISVSIKKGEFEERFNEIDPASVKFAVGLLKDIKKSAKLTDKIKLSDILLFQNMLFKDDSEQASEEFGLVTKAIDLAVSELNKMRDAEGSELEKDLRKRIAIIELALTKIETSASLTVKEYFEKLKDRAAQLVGDLANNTDRLNVELALLSERSDVTEECVRLRSHIKMFIDTLEKSEDAGRRLNFIVQEMNREANTINSKSLASEISHSGILIKEEIEKIREQIQNIE